MSHLVSVDVEFRDLDALTEAARECGLEFRHGQTEHRYYGGAFGKCDHAISVPDKSAAYEIGVIDHGDGTYRLVFDGYQGGHGLIKLAGRDLSKLTAAYVFAAAERQAAQLGWMHQRQGDELIIYHPSGNELRVNAKGEVEAHGFQGVGCADAVREISGVLGAESDVTVKPEANMCQQTIRRTTT